MWRERWPLSAAPAKPVNWGAFGARWEQSGGRIGVQAWRSGRVPPCRRNTIHHAAAAAQPAARRPLLRVMAQFVFHGRPLVWSAHAQACHAAPSSRLCAQWCICGESRLDGGRSVSERQPAEQAGWPRMMVQPCQLLFIGVQPSIHQLQEQLAQDAGGSGTESDAHRVSGAALRRAARLASQHDCPGPTQRGKAVRFPSAETAGRGSRTCSATSPRSKARAAQ